MSFQGYAPIGPDPDSVIGDIEIAGEERAKTLSLLHPGRDRLERNGFDAWAG